MGSSIKLFLFPVHLDSTSQEKQHQTCPGMCLAHSIGRALRTPNQSMTNSAYMASSLAVGLYGHSHIINISNADWSSMTKMPCIGSWTITTDHLSPFQTYCIKVNCKSAFDTNECRVCSEFPHASSSLVLNVPKQSTENLFYHIDYLSTSSIFLIVSLKFPLLHFILSIVPSYTPF